MRPEDYTFPPEQDPDDPDSHTIDAEVDVPEVGDFAITVGGKTVGSIRVQEPGTVVRRPPTAAETRARAKAIQARLAAQRFAREQAEASDRKREQNRKTLMGAVAVVGVVGAVALGYQLFKAGPDVTASCVDSNNVVVPDSNCQSGTPSAGGFFIYAGSPYRYYYGGTTGGVGTVATGGSLTQPRGTTAKTKSGSSISRGGFGSSSVGGSGGG